MGQHCLVVSENAAVRRALSERLAEFGIQVTQAADGTEALRVVRSLAVDVVLLGCRGPSPGIHGLQGRILRENPNIRVIPVTSFGAVRSSTELLRFGRDDYLIGVGDLAHLMTTVAQESDGGRTGLDGAVRSLTETLDVLVGLLELGDRYFAGSAHRSRRLCTAVAEQMGLDRWAVDEVSIAALLRDLGKVGVPESVRDSADPYTLEQFERMKEHVDASVRLLEHIEFPWKIVQVIRHHHERYDGRGYPDGLRGREIPLGSRILSVVDAYIALTSERPHRDSTSPEEAIRALEHHAGTQFDPEVVEILIRIVDKRPHIAGAEQGRVLLADPQTDFRELLQLRFLNEGFEVAVADDLDSAIDAFDGEVPDVLVVDPGPGVDDVRAFLDRVRNEDRLEALPVVVLSRNDDPSLKLRALRQGVDEWFGKSGDLDELLARVENLLQRERRRADPQRKRRRGVSGTLDNLALPEIVQTLVIGTKTASVRIRNHEGRGRLWFQDGSLVHAKCGRLSGRDAFLELLRWRDGDFVIEHGVKTRASTIEEDAMFLVMEGLRVQDEENAGAEPAAS